MKKIFLILTLLLVGCGKSFNINNVYTNLNELKDNDKLIYQDMEKLDKDYIAGNYSFYENLYDEILVVMSNDTSKVDQYIIVKTNNDEMLEKINAYFDSLETRCEMYDIVNANKVKNRLEDEINGYKVYIISDNNELVLKTIENS